MFPAAGRGARPHLPAHRRRDHRRARAGAARTGGRRRERRQHDGRLLRHRSAHRRAYLYLETLGGGFGGRATKDGKDGVQVHITNTSNLPVEAIEMEYPLRVESYGLVEIRRDPARIAAASGCAASSGRSTTAARSTARGARSPQPWGIFGGGNGAAGRFVLAGPDGGLQQLPTKPNGVTVNADRTHRRLNRPVPAATARCRSAAAEAIERDRAERQVLSLYIEKNYGLPRAAEVARWSHRWN